MFDYEDTVLYYEKRKQDSIEKMLTFKNELLEVTWSPENMKYVMDEDEYAQLIERWNHK